MRGESRRALATAVALGLLVGGLAGYVIRGAGASPQGAAGPGAADADVQTDPRFLVVQAQDVPADYSVYADPNPADPGHTNPTHQYAVAMTQKGVPAYLAESGVNLYASRALTGAALKTMLSLGSFGAELPLHGTLGEEAHLFAAKDQGVVAASLLWRDRNAVAFIFLYNPYSDSTPAAEVDRIARGNAYDNALSLATVVEGRIRTG